MNARITIEDYHERLRLSVEIEGQPLSECWVTRKAGVTSYKPIVEGRTFGWPDEVDKSVHLLLDGYYGGRDKAGVVAWHV